MTAKETYFLGWENGLMHYKNYSDTFSENQWQHKNVFINMSSNIENILVVEVFKIKNAFRNRSKSKGVTVYFRTWLYFRRLRKFCIFLQCVEKCSTGTSAAEYDEAFFTQKFYKYQANDAKKIHIKSDFNLNIFNFTNATFYICSTAMDVS